MLSSKPKNMLSAKPRTNILPNRQTFCCAWSLVLHTPARSKCTWALHKSNFAQQIGRNMLDLNFGDIALREFAHSKRTWTITGAILNNNLHTRNHRNTCNHTYTHTHSHTYTPTHLHTYIHTYIPTYLPTYIHTIPYHTIQYHCSTIQYVTLHYITVHYVHTYTHRHRHKDT